MKTYEIVRCETIAKQYIIEAENEEEAENKLLNGLETGEIKGPGLADCVETWISSVREIEKGATT